MDLGDLSRLALPLGLFSLGVALLLYLAPRAPKIFLDRSRKRVQIADVKELSRDTKRYRLALDTPKTILGLPVGKHLVLYLPSPNACLDSGKWNGKDDPDRGKQEVERKYTPVTGDETPGYVDLVVKLYRPCTTKMPDGKEVTWADGGKAGSYLEGKKPGDFVEIMGPVGVNEYLGRGMFKLPGRTVTVRRVGMMAGGTGLTPMLQVAQAAIRDKNDTCSFSLIYANKTEDDILCREMLDELAESSQGRFRVHYTLDFPPTDWKHKVGFISKSMIQECLPPPSTDTLILMCGPPPMVDRACKQNLEELGYAKTTLVAF
jgi:cytochrome-b5 reductase